MLMLLYLVGMCGNFVQVRPLFSFGNTQSDHGVFSSDCCMDEEETREGGGISTLNVLMLGLMDDFWRGIHPKEGKDGG